MQSSLWSECLISFRLFMLQRIITHYSSRYIRAGRSRLPILFIHQIFVAISRGGEGSRGEDEKSERRGIGGERSRHDRRGVLKKPLKPVAAKRNRPYLSSISWRREPHSWPSAKPKRSIPTCVFCSFKTIRSRRSVRTGGSSSFAVFIVTSPTTKTNDTNPRREVQIYLESIPRIVSSTNPNETSRLRTNMIYNNI